MKLLQGFSIFLAASGLALASSRQGPPDTNLTPVKFRQVGSHLRVPAGQIRKLSTPERQALLKKFNLTQTSSSSVTLTTSSPAANGYTLEGWDISWEMSTGIDMHSDSRVHVSLTPSNQGITTPYVVTFSNNWVETNNCTAQFYGPYRSAGGVGFPLLSSMSGQIGSSAPPFAVVAPKGTQKIVFQITNTGSDATSAGFYTSGINGVTIEPLGN